MVSEIASCSRSSRAAAEPLAGTAPMARAWIVLEHPGPWGRDAITDSGLDPQLVSFLTDALQTWGVRTVLARHDARRRLRTHDTKNVWVAACNQTGSHGRHGYLKDLREVRHWDPAAIANGHVPDFGQEMDQPWEFICTHSKRDVCCATLGRRYLSERAFAWAKDIGDVEGGPWECSHLGGHRFAPTSLFLPSGRLYGRLDQFQPHEALSEPCAEALRGASYLQPWEQVADQAVRALLDVPSSTATHVRPINQNSIDDHQEGFLTVDVPSHGSWTVHIVPSTISSLASCGTDSKTRTVWQVRGVTQEEE